MQALGAIVEARPDDLLIRGPGLRAAAQPTGTIDVGNAGTLLRLLPGWLAGQADGVWVLDGDESIRRRPVDRIAEPLRLMGARLEAREGRFTPLTVTGAPPHRHRLRRCPSPRRRSSRASCSPACWPRARPACASRGRAATTPSACSSRPARASSATATVLTVHPQDELEVDRIDVPGDPSSVAFHAAAAMLVPGSRIVLEGVAVNWTRVGFLRIAQRMGAVVVGPLEAPQAGIPAEEPVAELDVCDSALGATVVEADEVPLAIDELPLVALLGCFAEGETVVRGAEELRLKETDRITAVVDGLRGLGATIEATQDGFAVTGTGGLRGGVDGGPRRPPAGDARGRRRPGLARGRRGRGDGGGRGVLPRFHGRPRAPAQPGLNVNGGWVGEGSDAEATSVTSMSHTWSRRHSSLAVPGRFPLLPSRR